MLQQYSMNIEYRIFVPQCAGNSEVGLNSILFNVVDWYERKDSQKIHLEGFVRHFVSSQGTYFTRSPLFIQVQPPHHLSKISARYCIKKRKALEPPWYQKWKTSNSKFLISRSILRKQAYNHNYVGNFLKLKWTV